MQQEVFNQQAHGAQAGFQKSERELAFRVQYEPATDTIWVTGIENQVRLGFQRTSLAQNEITVEIYRQLDDGIDNEALDASGESTEA